MAVLWRQKELLLCLEELAQKQFEEICSEHDTNDHKVIEILGTVSMSRSGFHIYENELVAEMLEKKSKTQADLHEIFQIKRDIDAAIENKFILSTKNNSYTKDVEPGDLEKSSRRLLSINPDKGSELLDETYFFWKYLSSEFPPLTAIGTAVLTALLTSGLLWITLLGEIRESVVEPVLLEQNK